MKETKQILLEDEEVDEYWILKTDFETYVEKETSYARKILIASNTILLVLILAILLGVGGVIFWGGN